MPLYYRPRSGPRHTTRWPACLGEKGSRKPLVGGSTLPRCAASLNDERFVEMPIELKLLFVNTIESIFHVHRSRGEGKIRQQFRLVSENHELGWAWLRVDDDDEDESDASEAAAARSSLSAGDRERGRAGALGGLDVLLFVAASTALALRPLAAD
jgi:hypothetical protein